MITNVQACYMVSVPCTDKKPAQFINFANVIKVIYGPNTETITLKFVDGSAETYTDERYQVLLEEVKKWAER